VPPGPVSTEQVVPGAVHPGQFACTPEHTFDSTSMQHGCPTAPHAPQLPSAHVPRASPHTLPAATQLASTQQPPASHDEPSQQNWPGLPQFGSVVPPPLPDVPVLDEAVTLPELAAPLPSLDAAAVSVVTELHAANGAEAKRSAAPAQRIDRR
jgi:hypothetical protein